MLYRIGTVLLWPILNFCLAIQVATMFRVLVTHREHYFGNNWKIESEESEISQALETHSFNASACQKTEDTQWSKKNYVKLSVDHYEKMHPFATKAGDTSTVLRITSWTKLQPVRHEWMKHGMTPFLNCTNLDPWMKCYYSAYAPSMLKHSHAVLFHARHMRRNKGVPDYRPPGQKWIFYEHEPPTTTWNKVNSKWPFWHLFNITATYTTDSDIPLLFNRPKCQEIPLPKVYKSVDFAVGKDGRVLWISDECSTASQREVYVSELAKFIPVDTFGACGKPICGSKDKRNNLKDACITELLNSTYKFLLIFESAFCNEYITETIITAMKFNIIPVVMGLSDYTNMLPKGFWIDASRFETPENLAHFLEYIDQNDEMYNKFIKLKYSMNCQAVQQSSFPCQLCQYLHLNRYKEQQVADVYQFWSVKNRCQNPKRFYRGMADSILPKLKIPSAFS